MPNRFTEDRLNAVLAELRLLHGEALRLEAASLASLTGVAPGNRESALNLLHYLAVRRRDIRPLQRELSRLGLSSLGRMEAHVMASLRAVMVAAHAIAGKPFEVTEGRGDESGFDDGDSILARNADRALGPRSEERATRVMVTLPAEAANSEKLARDLIAGGMEIARINCAYGGPDLWKKMVTGVRRAAEAEGRKVRILFEIAGPKLRTGPMVERERVVSWKPRKTELGKVAEPLRIGFGKRERLEDDPATSSLLRDGRFDVFVPIAPDVAGKVQVGDKIRIVDVRGERRKLKVWGLWKSGWTCLAREKTILSEGAEIVVTRKGEVVMRATVKGIPLVEAPVRLSAGQEVLLRKGREPGTAAVRNADSRIICPATVSCDVHELFRDVEPGQRVYFDDGKAVSRVVSKQPEELLLRIERVKGQSVKLRAGKGINVPDTDLQIPMLAGDDRRALAFAAEHGDLAALSFIRRPADIDAVLAELRLLDAPSLGMVLKIETHEAFSSLPEILLRALQHPSIAVMVARGDLGVELGFERLTEVQEEILWLCEAAHVPVIWATQVLETLAKTGIPTRAEVTDAAMAVRAECVMLNKGPYIAEAVRFLDDVLERMQSHFDKKTATFRRLKVAGEEPAPHGAQVGSRRAGPDQEYDDQFVMSSASATRRPVTTTP